MTSCAPWPASRLAADEHDLLLAVRNPGELRAEPLVKHRDARGARDVRLVELKVGTHVHDQVPFRPKQLDLPRRERQQLDARGEKRTPVEVDDRLEVRWLGAEAR